ELDRERTYFVNVDSVSFGQVAYEISQGAVISFPHDRQLVELCEALATAGAADGGVLPIRHPLLDDALPPRVHRLRSITLRTTDEDGNLAPWYHTDGDVPGRVDSANLRHATEFVVALTRLIDRQAGRQHLASAAAGPAPEAPAAATSDRV